MKNYCDMVYCFVFVGCYRCWSFQVEYYEAFSSVSNEKERNQLLVGHLHTSPKYLLISPHLILR